jgi:hypothetical protein
MANQPICTPGDVTKDCQLCIETPYFDRRACAVAYNQMIASLRNSGYPQQEILKRAEQACQVAGDKKRPSWVSYNSVYACSQCDKGLNDNGKDKIQGNINTTYTVDRDGTQVEEPNIYRIPNIRWSDEALKANLEQCKDCEEELIPTSKFLRYKAKFTGGVNPNSCDTCEKKEDANGELEGVLVQDGECKKMNEKNNDPRYRWDAVYVLGKCKCVRRCEECLDCEECARASTALDAKETCKGKCEEGPSFICEPDGGGCYCKFKLWADGPRNPPYVRCPSSSPHVIYNDDLSCECGCLCEGTNVVCATDNDNNFIGCKCKYVTPEQYAAMLGAGNTDFFQQATECDEPDVIIATDDGGCTCGYEVSSNRWNALNLLP